MLYEITFVRTNGQIETRYTDRPAAVGDTVVIDGRPCRVVERHPETTTSAAAERLVCEEMPYASTSVLRL